MANLTAQAQLETYEELFCSVKITGGTTSQLTCLAVLNTILSITAFLGNTLILVAVHKQSPLHPPTRFLLCTLATTDVCVGAIAEPLVIIYWVSVVKESWGVCRYAQASVYVTGHMFCSVSLLTLTTISVERLLALLLGSRYRQVVTLRRTQAAVAVLWIVSIVGSTMYFVDYVITLRYGYIGAPLCLVISVFSYAKIFHSLRRHRNQVQNLICQDQPNQTNVLNMARYRKALTSALWLQLLLVLCYLPYVTVGIFMSPTRLTPSIYVARQTALTLVFLNSTLNPILYCWKITEIRKSVKETVTKLYCLPSN